MSCSYRKKKANKRVIISVYTVVENCCINIICDVHIVLERYSCFNKAHVWSKIGNRLAGKKSPNLFYVNCSLMGQTSFSTVSFYRISFQYLWFVV